MGSAYEVSALSRVLWGAVAAGIVLVLVLSALVVLGNPLRWLPGLPGASDCTARVRGTEVGLDSQQAQRAASVAARSVRLGVPMRTTTVAVADAIDSSPADGRVVATALTGRARAAFTCGHGGGLDAASPELGPQGLTARAAVVRRDLDRAFGRQSVGGFAPGGVSAGHMRGSAHYAGRAVDVFFRPVDARNRARGWAVAHYLVAHAERLAVSTVIFDDRIWTARRSGEGWRDYAVDTRGRPRRVAAVLEHRDHVHVDVFG